MQIRLVARGHRSATTLYDKRLPMALLPWSLVMEDDDSIACVVDLTHQLAAQGASEGTMPAASELAHYSRWSNLATFIEERSYLYQSGE